AVFDAYLARNKLKEYHNGSRRHVAAVLRLGGATREECDRVAEFVRYGSGYFDHMPILGRDGKPARLSGSPRRCTPIPSRDDRVLDDVRALGLKVEVTRPETSHYGFGTLQVEVSGPGRPPRSSSGRRPPAD